MTAVASAVGSSVRPAETYSDPETGFLYLRARYYDPATAQFLSPDPMFALTGERYGYAGNNPLNGSDPSGLCGPFGNGACPGASTVRHVAHDVNNDVVKPAGRARRATTSYVESWVPNCVTVGNSGCTSLGDTHPVARDALYVTAGAAATVASGGLALEAIGLSSFATEGMLFTGGMALTGEGLASTGFGLAAASGDYGRCVHDRDQLACAGLYSGGLGAALGLPALYPGFALLGVAGAFLGAGGLAVDAFSLSRGLYNRLAGCP